ncbi:MAG: SET domain-containing protein-lysine N-methyltransferase [Patescibacteria group bacterium]|nr:SET domain-containing protein-lysine N-methyltransferase [Patescibacteria group bacterium]
MKSSVAHTSRQEQLLAQLQATPRINGFVSPDTEVRESPIHGLGLFATADIARGSVLVAWGGHVLTKGDLALLPPHIAHNYALEIYPGFYLVEMRDDELDGSDFPNHSCEPNGAIVNTVVGVASRDIVSGEEITFDFSSPSGTGERVQCRCGSERCTGEVIF